MDTNTEAPKADPTRDRLSSPQDVRVQLSVVLARKELPMRDILNMARGSVIPFDRRVGAPVDLFINNRLVARGEIQISDTGSLEIQINEVATAAGE